ncbi:helix-turn-helix domain-containing protein [Cesiribacter sp. SM1]|uniref:helix-turn-helix domain-containing protein n=1 Tax=Cesiribacter sp. SM1 TaxID=2861196 RepID=UPI00271513F5|nr:helix-turn-helix domain-containing protein [Cesiribacter sp. SM1]
MAQHQNEQLQLANDFVEYTSKHVFLTGKAGTGKTTFLQNLKKRLPKRMVVVAPTGVAAMNAGGVTIHSFFQIPFGPYIPGAAAAGSERQIKKFSREKINIIRSLDLLVIDEISMVRADVLDAIDEVLRRYRDRNQPFGGVQLLMIGDLQQLAPIAREEEWKLLREYYQTVFFFGSRALQQTEYVPIMLQHIYRQSDSTFINILNGIRENKLNGELLQHLNSRCLEGFSPSADEGYITLTTHNNQAQQINERELQKLKGKEFKFSASTEGDFPEYLYPTEQHLILKKESQVMFVKNDQGREKRYYNGKIGTVKDVYEDTIVVQCPGDEDPIYVERVEWHNYKYALNDNTKEIEESVAGVFRQYPLKLAWAITIHKSQGLTFDRAIIDANAAFTHGQVYVALSRCRSLEGLVLTQPLSPGSIISDASILGFNGRVAQNQPGQQALQAARQAYQQRLLLELFDFDQLGRRIGYLYKLVREHMGSLAGKPAEVVGTLELDFRKTIADVSHKFAGQMVKLGLYEASVEENEPLQARIKQAATYFAEKLGDLVLHPLKELTLETDNKEVRKSLKQASENLYQEAFIKEASLLACREGFKAHTYLEARAKAALEEVNLKPQKKEKESEQYYAASDNPDLYRRIREYRDEKAIEYDLPHYMILPLKTMEELASRQPRTMAALKKVKGLGKKKIEQMGEDLLAIINSMAKGDIPEQESVAAAIEEEKEAAKPKKEKKDTKQQSFELFQEGKSIEEVAQIRGLATGTVETHLLNYISTGEIDIKRLMSRHTLETILGYYGEKGSIKLGEAKEALGDAVSYFELRAVMRHLEYEEGM